jgi:hypothetical protein
MALSCLVAARADAAAFQLQMRTEAQAYQIRSYTDADPYNPVLLPRRRIVQYLGLNAFELITGEDLGFESNLRVYTDFGLPRGVAAKIDGLRSEDADLLYAHVHYRRGGLEARLGRQLYTDVMDLMAFDGLSLRYMTASGFGAEVYGGLWVKGGGFLGSPNYQLDGVRELYRPAVTGPGYSPAVANFEPVVGAKLLAQGFAGFSGAVGYRRSFMLGKTTFERAAAELRYGTGRGLNAFAGLDFDLAQLRVGQARAELRYDGDFFAVSGEVLRLAPVLSASSIWYYFATAPRDEANLRVDILPPGPLRFYLRGTATRYNLEINQSLDLYLASLDAALPSGMTYGGSAGTALRVGKIRSALDATARYGSQARQFWLDYTLGYVPDHGRWTVDGRVSFASVRDGFNPNLRGNFFGLQAWGSYALTHAARVSLVLEGNSSPLTTYEAKAFALFDLKATL